MQRYLQFSRRKSMCACLVCRSEDSGIVGVCSLSQIFLGNLQHAFLGYWIGASYSGQGYMTEALDLLLSYAFETLRLHRVEADIQPENVYSKALVARIGFQMVGLFSAVSEGCGPLEGSRALGDRRSAMGETRSGRRRNLIRPPKSFPRPPTLIPLCDPELRNS